MSINSSLVKLADKIDVDGKSTISPEYKNPNNSIEKSIERIADNYNGSGGGGGGGGALYVTITSQDGENFTASKTFAEIKTAYDTGNAIIFVDDYNYYGCGIGYYADGVFYCSGMITNISEGSASLSVFYVEMTDESVIYDAGTTN